MITLALCTAGGLMALALLLLIGLPLALLLGFTPWFLGVVALVLFIKALLEKPLVLGNFAPAGIAFAASVLLRWIF